MLEIAELEDEPLLLPQRGFGSREWFDIACDIAHIRPRVLLESAAPHTLVALAATDYAIAILPSNARVPRDSVRAIPLVHRGASIGRWAHIAWDPQRFLAPYAEHFVTELTGIAGATSPVGSSSSARRLFKSQENTKGSSVGHFNDSGLAVGWTVSRAETCSKQCGTDREKPAGSSRTSCIGTNAKCRHVCFCAAVGVIADLTQTSFEDRC